MTKSTARRTTGHIRAANDLSPVTIRWCHTPVAMYAQKLLLLLASSMVPARISDGPGAVGPRRAAAPVQRGPCLLQQPGRGECHCAFHVIPWVGVTNVGLLLAGAAALSAIVLGLAVRPLLPLELRRRHNDVTAAIFSVIGVTFAVLLAFVAMVVWQHYNEAKATSSAEAGLVRDVYYVSLGFSDPDKSLLRDGILGYVETVVGVEWPAQARGLSVASNSAWLNKLNAIAADLKPAGTADDIRQAMLSLTLMRLSDAREQRLMAADTTVPAVVWIVTLMGGALTVAFASLLGVPSLGMHLAMSAAMAISGALVLIMIIALNNPFRGDFRVSAEPFEQVIAQVRASE